MYISPSGEYPLFYGDVQLRHPDWEPGLALPEGWREVKASPLPAPSLNTIVYELEPLEIDGVLTQQWATREMTAEEIEALELDLINTEKLDNLGRSEEPTA